MSSVTFGKRNLARAAEPVAARDSATLAGLDAPARTTSTAGLAAGGTRPRLGWRLLLAAIAFPAVWLGIIYYQGAPLLRDYRQSASFQNDFTVKIENAHCTVYWFVLKTCSVDYRILDVDPPDVQTTNFMVAFTGTEGRLVRPMRSNIDRSAVTTQIALELMTNRILTFLTIVVGMLTFMVAVVRKMLRPDLDGGEAAGQALRA